MAAKGSNVVRKASGTEKEKMSKSAQYMEEIEKADAAEVMDDDTREVIDALVREEAEDDSVSLEDLALEYAECTRVEGAAAARKDALKPIFKNVLGLAGMDRAVTDRVAVELVEGTSPRKLDATKLLAEGVNLEVINRCYVGGGKYKYALVRLRKPKVGE